MILFLDFDGVMHTHNQRAFKHLHILEEIMLDFPQLRIVLSTSWREHQSLTRLRSPFHENVRYRVIDVTPVMYVNLEPPYVDHVRFKEISLWLEQNGNPEWIALDDDYREFPDNCKELIICNPKLGLNDPDVISELRRRLSK